MTSAAQVSGTGSRPRVVVVSRVHRPLSPRTIRARAVETSLGDLGWECVRWPETESISIADASRSRPIRRGFRKLAERTVLLDRFEPASLTGRRILEGLDMDAGYLVGPTFSHPVAAASALRRQGKPYVVDSGDPWSLEARLEGSRGWANVRRERAETELLGGSAGIVVTTALQASEIEARFPGIPLLVRPNGFQTVEPEPISGPSGRDPDVLKLAHFGRFDMSVRLDPMPMLIALAESGLWRKVVFTQFGPDPAELPGSFRADVDIEVRELLPWPEVLTESKRHDAAIVIGNRSERKMQLPSKAIEYLGLPIPRIALCSGPGESLYEYAGRLPGYLVLTEADREVADRVAKHLDRVWSARDLEPPGEESWDAVAPEVAGFVDRCLRSPGDDPPRLLPAARSRDRTEAAA